MYHLLKIFRSVAEKTSINLATLALSFGLNMGKMSLGWNVNSSFHQKIIGSPCPKDCKALLDLEMTSKEHLGRLQNIFECFRLVV